MSSDRANVRDLVGDVPVLGTMESPFSSAPPQIRGGQGGRSTHSAARLNMRAVADVLERYGLDPIEEVAKVLTETQPLLDRHGNAVIDEKTGQPIQVDKVAGETRLRTLLELAQYTRAKLKATEVTIKAPELTNEQIDARLQALLARQGK